jgi:hypothetical protein
VKATYPPFTALGKRLREAEGPQGNGGLVGVNTYNMPPPKRARGRTSGIPKAKRSAASTRHNFVARIPQTKINRKPKEAGRGAERLATSNVHGFYYQSSLGPSFQQGWAAEPAHGKPTWVEGSVDEDAAHRTNSTVQQEQQQEGAKELFKIPRTLTSRYRFLLDASEADWARGAVQTIQCRLCPGTEFSTFEEFKRHCKSTETHPLEIAYCDHCGDFFGRTDSLKRHRNQPPPECRKVSPTEAAKKRRTTMKLHKRFLRRLDDGLLTVDDITTGFAQMIKSLYPQSSKKRTGGSQ